MVVATITAKNPHKFDIIVNKDIGYLENYDETMLMELDRYTLYELDKRLDFKKNGVTTTKHMR